MKRIIIGGVLLISILFFVGKSVNAAVPNPWCGILYKNYPTGTYGDIKCPSGTDCLPTKGCLSYDNTIGGVSYKGRITYRCFDVEKDKEYYVSESLAEICRKEGPDTFLKKLTEVTTQAKKDEACLSQATSTERGIFTRDLSPKCFACGECTQKDIFQEFINIFTFILQISGSLAVLVMVVGGIMYMTAAGDQQKTGKAKAALTAAIVGLIIVIASFILINFVMQLLGYSNANPWYTFSPTIQ